VIRSVVFHRLAKKELGEAVHWYNSKSPGLGWEFLKEIERCVGSILDHPEAASLIAEPVRRRLAQRFPYALQYSARPSTLRILAVMHLKRRPMYWAGRE
jgi:plasmid stabilization system protein ParE